MRFKPSLLSILVLIPLAAGFCSLGFWQLSRADFKGALLDQYDEVTGAHWEAVDESTLRYTPVSGSGHYDTKRHILLDNQLLKGQPGIHVFTPFQFDDGRWVLVNRGWLPLGPRREIPVFHTPDESITISGRLNLPPDVGLRLGDAKPLNSTLWPNLMTYLDLSKIESGLGVSIHPQVIQLAASEPAGFGGRDWPVVNFGPDKHVAYAVQWFALSVTVLIVFMLLGNRRARGLN